MLEPKIDLHTVAIPPPRDCDWRGNDFTSNPLGTNSTVVASSPWTLGHVFVLIEATVNGCAFVSSFLHLDLNCDDVEDGILCLNP